jgi:hypothetical protein
MSCCYQSKSGVVEKSVIERIVLMRNDDEKICCEVHYKLKDTENAVIDEYLHRVPFEDLDLEMQKSATTMASRFHLALDKKLASGELQKFIRTDIDISAITI